MGHAICSRYPCASRGPSSDPIVLEPCKRRMTVDGGTFDPAFCPSPRPIICSTAITTTATTVSPAATSAIQRASPRRPALTGINLCAHSGQSVSGQTKGAATDMYETYRHCATSRCTLLAHFRASRRRWPDGHYAADRSSRLRHIRSHRKPFILAENCRKGAENGGFIGKCGFAGSSGSSGGSVAAGWSCCATAALLCPSPLGPGSGKQCGHR
jgi:hypothetical protein